MWTFSLWQRCRWRGEEKECIFNKWCQVRQSHQWLGVPDPSRLGSAVTVVCGNSLESLMGATDSKRRAECQHAPLLLCLENRMWSLFQMQYISMCYIFLEAWILVAIRKERITSATINEPPFCLYMVIRNFYSYSLGYYFHNLAVFCETVACFQGLLSVLFCCPFSLGNCLRDEMQKAV